MNRLTIFLLLTLPILFACTQKEPQVPKEVLVESVTISQSSAEIEIGKTLQLNATVSPSTATRKDITWSSSKSSVASVSSSGLVSAVSEGTATIAASADGKKGECTVTVVKKAIAVSEIRLDKTELTLYEGDEEILTAAIIPTDATPKEDISWSSSNSDVATVDGGKVTAVSMGDATITASLEGFKAECNVTVKGMEYGKIAITDLRPIDILPIVGQVNDSNGSYADERWYNSLDPLRIAEAYHIIEMMWTYGAGGYSPDEYKSLMDRLNVIMVNETPLVYDNYEVIRDLDNLWSLRPPSRHAYLEWFVLNSLLKHANFKIIFNPLENYKPSEPVFDHSLIREYSNNHPNSINILASSTGADYRYIRFRDRYENGDWFTEKNVLQFTAAPNREVHFEDDGSMTPSLNIVCQMDAELPNDTSAYEETASYTNGINDPIADKHNIVTIATCEAGDFDFTDYNVESTCFPIGFHDDVLFAGRQFPLTGGPEKPNLIVSSKGPWANSFCNYFNAAIASLCFQIKADMKDVDELLEMLRTTSLTDYVRQDGMTQRLHLMNPGGVIKKYLLPTNLPDAVGSDGSIELEKGYYKGVIFNVPGAEVRVNGEWIAFDNKNKEVILSHNPMNLEWRLNGDLLKRYGYTPGQTVEGQIMTVDDNWGGLRLEVPMSIQVR